MMNREESGRVLILKGYPGIFLEELRKTTKNLSQESRLPGRDLILVTTEYEAGVLTTRVRRSVKALRDAGTCSLVQEYGLITDVRCLHHERDTTG
jgi:hypothetical protein